MYGAIIQATLTVNNKHMIASSSNFTHAMQAWLNKVRKKFTISMEQGSCEANSRSASRAIPPLLKDPKYL
jgi:hypothetical protein